MGLVGCGFGGVLGGAGFKALEKELKPPSKAKKLARTFTSFFEPAYEKFLSLSLSKDTKAIQVWRLRKTLKPAKTK
jgi:hypothetical protein